MYIQATNLSFAYREGSENVINNLSLQIEKGSFTVILGRNGSGKSTLAKLLCGMLMPSSGSVTVDGLSTSDEENGFEIRKRCGMVFQNPDNQLVSGVVDEDVAFAPENLGFPREKILSTVEECLKTVDMLEYRHHATHKLSGGQKQRIAIAGILAMDPMCIVFDEATAMLDPTGRREICAAMRRLNREKGITVIAITHYMDEAAAADRIVVLEKGSIYMDGTPRQIFSQVDKMNLARLSVPQVTQLIHLLNAEGEHFDNGIITEAEAADALERRIRR